MTSCSCIGQLFSGFRAGLNPKAEKRFKEPGQPYQRQVHLCASTPMGPDQIGHHLKKGKRNDKREVQKPSLLIAPFNPVSSENYIQTASLTKY